MRFSQADSTSSVEKSHDIVILSFCTIVKGQGNCDFFQNLPLTFEANINSTLFFFLIPSCCFHKTFCENQQYCAFFKFGRFLWVRLIILEGVCVCPPMCIPRCMQMCPNVMMCMGLYKGVCGCAWVQFFLNLCLVYLGSQFLVSFEAIFCSNNI